LAKKWAQNPTGRRRKVTSEVFAGPPGTTTWPFAVVCTEPGRSQKCPPAGTGVWLATGAGVSVTVAARVEVEVARVGVVVSAGVAGGFRQPFRALFTALVISLMDTRESSSLSNLRQASMLRSPRAIFTPVTISLIVTRLLWLQSPTQTSDNARVSWRAPLTSKSTAPRATQSRTEMLGERSIAVTTPFSGDQARPRSRSMIKYDQTVKPLCAGAAGGPRPR
jgi:hypothetical protein